MVFMSFVKYISGGSVVKNPPVNAGNSGLIPGLGRSPGKGNGKPTPVFLPGKSHEQRPGGQQSMELHNSQIQLSI